ncbi:unnamed protein product [Darwinula stevensoni]|uniref:cystathionine gamma-lyase n=1 Tax=Darwinula stevensoni TaxID=69355 RepID=A0A7R8X713_9CRUS|nr:unnamed protein product [Darwinula stevensoni]CAG0886374.1 unnamed protein product [Darwinula stevensoni]
MPDAAFHELGQNHYLRCHEQLPSPLVYYVTVTREGGRELEDRAIDWLPNPGRRLRVRTESSHDERERREGPRNRAGLSRENLDTDGMPDASRGGFFTLTGSYVSKIANVTFTSVTEAMERVVNLPFVCPGAGCVPSPFDCYLTLRSLKTLSLRMRRHMTSSLQVAQFLASHPLVERVIHPGLEDYEYKELLRRQTKGYSGMLSFYVAGDRETARLFTGHLKIVTHADSLGGAESVVKIP